MAGDLKRPGQETTLAPIVSLVPVSLTPTGQKAGDPLWQHGHGNDQKNDTGKGAHTEHEGGPCKLSSDHVQELGRTGAAIGMSALHY